MTDAIASTRVHRWVGDALTEQRDEVVVEEPCEIRLDGEAVAVVMRTPGHDRELAAGFLYTEGIVAPGDIGTISYCQDADVLNAENLVEVRLAPGRQPRGSWQRNFYAASSCGICGKASIEAIHLHAAPISDGVEFPRPALRQAMDHLRARQSVFDRTGGLHAAGLFDSSGAAIAVREDIGRHNAVDKVIGHSYLAERLPLGGHLLAVSGRCSFEIVQKALAAAIPIVAGVSAASSLAIDLARESNLTLVGFVRGDAMVIYSAPGRLR